MKLEQKSWYNQKWYKMMNWAESTAPRQLPVNISCLQLRRNYNLQNIGQKIKQYEQKSFPVNKIENSEKITSTLWTIDSLYKSKAREHWYIPGKIFLSQIIWKMCLFVWNLHQHVPQEPSWENCLHQSLELWSFSQNSRWLCCLLENYFHLKLC